jgi:hypothetical protein
MARRATHWRHGAAAALLASLAPQALAQDIPGLELCTAEKQMERRTGCLQSNDDYLQQQMLKLTREMNAKFAASGRELAAAKAEIAALKAKLDELAKARTETGKK